MQEASGKQSHIYVKPTIFHPIFGALRGYYGVGSDSGRGAGKWFWYEVVVGEND